MNSGSTPGPSILSLSTYFGRLITGIRPETILLPFLRFVHAARCLLCSALARTPGRRRRSQRRHASRAKGRAAHDPQSTAVERSDTSRRGERFLPHQPRRHNDRGNVLSGHEFLVCVIAGKERDWCRGPMWLPPHLCGGRSASALREILRSESLRPLGPCPRYWFKFQMSMFHFQDSSWRFQ